MKIFNAFITVLATASLTYPAVAQTMPELKLSPDKTGFCAGEKITLTLSGGSPVVRAKIKYGDKKNNEEIYSYVFGNNESVEHIYLEKGKYEITYQVWYKDYPDPSDEKSAAKITVGETPDLTLDDDPELAQLIATSSSAPSYSWFTVSRTGDETKLQNVADVLNYKESGKYKVVAESSDGCTAEAVKTVSYQKNLLADLSSIVVVNNVLTPNNDSRNDVLEIEDLGMYENPCEVKIFDKRGKLVFERSKYSNTDGFQGKDDKGNDLLAGTYYYVIKSKGRKGVAGFVDIIR